MKKTLFGLSLFTLASGSAAAASAGQANTSAIVMFLVFIAGTMGITWWAARRTRTTSDFYTAGGGLTGFQNGLAIAGDYLSAASFLGIARTTLKIMPIILIIVVYRSLLISFLNP